MQIDILVDLNSLIYFEFMDLKSHLNYFKCIGILDFVKSRSYRSEIMNCKKKLQINVVIDFIKDNYGPVFFDKSICSHILKVYSSYLFLYEYLKKGD